MKPTRFALTLLVTLGVAAYAPIAPAQVYLRLDTGYSWSRNAGIADKNFPVDQGICANATCTVPGKLNDTGNSMIFGAGVGYRINPAFRTDFTLGYRGGYDLSGRDGSVPATAFRAEIKSWAAMLNGYYDVPGGDPWKPYIGVGVGYARNKIDAISGSFVGVPGVTVTVPGGTKSGFAWSATAGVGYQLTRSAILEVGYRYMDLGNIESDAGALTTVPPTPGQTYRGAKGELRAHELTVGVRF